MVPCPRSKDFDHCIPLLVYLPKTPVRERSKVSHPLSRYKWYYPLVGYAQLSPIVHISIVLNTLSYSHFFAGRMTLLGTYQ